MYISRISPRPDASPRAISKILEDGYHSHAVVWEIMSGGRNNIARNFLYRQEIVNGRPLLYVVSEQPPAADLGMWSITSKPYEPLIREGDRYSFVLRANPVRTPNKREEPHKRKRLDVVLEAQTQLQQIGKPRTEWPSVSQLAQEYGTQWLLQRQESCGFTIATSVEGVPAVIAEAYERQKFSKHKSHYGGSKIAIASIDFRGILHVTDAALFRDKLWNGIGRGKAFGCGLLLIRRA